MPPRRLSDKQTAFYRDQLTVSHRRFEAQAKPIMERMTAYFKGNQWTEQARIEAREAGIPPLVFNLIFSDIKVILPTLALRNPKVFIKPTAASALDPATGQPVQFIPAPPGTVDPNTGQPMTLIPVPIGVIAQAKEALINWRWRELKLKSQVRRCLTDAMTAPFGIMKVGYTVQTEKVEPGEGELLEANELIRANSPFAVRWPPEDFRADPDARYSDLSDASWIAFGWRARLEDVLRNSRFHNTRGLKATVEVKTDFTKTGLIGPFTGGTAGMTLTGGTDDFMRVQLWELWDKRRSKRLVLADDHEQPLEYVDWPQAYENFPAETLYMTEYPDTFYPLPDLWQVLWQQDSVNEIAAVILNHIRRFLRKYVAQRGAFDEKELEKLKLPIDGIVVLTDATDVTKAITPLQDAPIPVDWWTGKTAYRDDHDRIAGLGDFIRGVAEKVDTATEAALIQSNMSVRVNDARDGLEDFACRVSRQLLQIDAQTLEVPKVIPVVGPDGALALGQFVQLQSREMLQAETDVEVEIGSMQPIDQDRRKRDVLELVAMFRNDPLIDQFELRQKLLPAYRDTIPEMERLLVSKEQFAQQIGPAMMQTQPGGDGGGPEKVLAGQPAPAPGI